MLIWLWNDLSWKQNSEQRSQVLAYDKQYVKGLCRGAKA